MRKSRLVGARWTAGFALVTTIALGSTQAHADVTDPTGQPFSATAGVQFDGTIATFTSTYAELTNFSATVDWGDGTADTSGEISSCSDCPRYGYTVDGTHTYAGAGSYTVTVFIDSLRDGTQGAATATATVTAPGGVGPTQPPVLVDTSKPPNGPMRKVCEATKLPGPAPTIGGLKYKRILGTDQANVLTGTAGHDLIVGRGGKDKIKGLAGRDIICGGTGNDVIDAGEHGDFVDGDETPGSKRSAAQGTDKATYNDVIAGGNGPDVIRGDAGRDRIWGDLLVTVQDIEDAVNDGTLQTFLGDGSDELLGGAGPDRIDGGPGDDEVDGAAGNDVVSGDGIHLNNDLGCFGCANRAWRGGGGFTANLDYPLGEGEDTVHGGVGNDDLAGGEGVNLLSGGSGNDSAVGDGCEDVGLPGGGTILVGDKISGGSGKDSLQGGGCRDEVEGGSGPDQIHGDPGTDAGFGSDDLLTGGTGNDNIDGGPKNDSCDGQGGTDSATHCESVSGVP